MEEKREAYQGQIEAEFKKWDEEIRKFKDKREQAKLQAKLKYMEQIEKLKEKVKKVEGKKSGQIETPVSLNSREIISHV
jgi:hypothetical protein